VAEEEEAEEEEEEEEEEEPSPAAEASAATRRFTSPSTSRSSMRLSMRDEREALEACGGLGSAPAPAACALQGWLDGQAGHGVAGPCVGMAAA
jgi:hypothetical protein